MRVSCLLLLVVLALGLCNATDQAASATGNPSPASGMHPDGDTQTSRGETGSRGSSEGGHGDRHQIQQVVQGRLSLNASSTGAETLFMLVRTNHGIWARAVASLLNLEHVEVTGIDAPGGNMQATRGGITVSFEGHGEGARAGDSEVLGLIQQVLLALAERGTPVEIDVAGASLEFWPQGDIDENETEIALFEGTLNIHATSTGSDSIFQGFIANSRVVQRILAALLEVDVVELSAIDVLAGDMEAMDGEIVVTFEGHGSPSTVSDDAALALFHRWLHGLEQRGSPLEMDVTAASVVVRQGAREAAVAEVALTEEDPIDVTHGIASLLVSFSDSASDDGDLEAHLEQHSDSVRSALLRAYAFTQVTVLRVGLANHGRRLGGAQQSLTVEFEGVGASRTPEPSDFQRALQANLDRAGAGLTVHSATARFVESDTLATVEKQNKDCTVFYLAVGLVTAALALCTCGSGAAILLQRRRAATNKSGGAETAKIVDMAQEVEKPVKQADDPAARDCDSNGEHASTGTPNSSESSNQDENEQYDLKV